MFLAEPVPSCVSNFQRGHSLILSRDNPLIRRPSYNVQHVCRYICEIFDTIVLLSIEASRVLQADALAELAGGGEQRVRHGLLSCGFLADRALGAKVWSYTSYTSKEPRLRGGGPD